MRPSNGIGLSHGAAVIAVAVTVLLAGCSVGQEGTHSPDSLTCGAAHSLFSDSDSDSGQYSDAVVERLTQGVPEELRSAAKRLASFPSSADAWHTYDVDLSRMQQWAVFACGTSVAFPVELDDSTPRLDDYLHSVASDGDSYSVIVSGAPGLDAATELCEQALQNHARPSRDVVVEVSDSFGILLAVTDSAGRCNFSPTLAE